MLTKDFTGAYDYEKTEAQSEADYLLENLACSYYSPEQFGAAKAKIIDHWSKLFRNEPESLAEFIRYFNERLQCAHTTIG